MFSPQSQNNRISETNHKIKIGNGFDLALAKSWLKTFDIFRVIIKMKYQNPFLCFLFFVLASALY